MVSSIAGTEVTPAPLPYSSAKAALTNYAKNLARQVASSRHPGEHRCAWQYFVSGRFVGKAHLEARQGGKF